MVSGLAGSAHGTVVIQSIDLSGATSSQSSNWNGFSSIGAEALDGNLGTNTHTASGDTAPAWSVDFGVDQSFSKLVIHNRDNCCADRLSDLTVRAFDASSTEIFNSGVVNPGNALGSPEFITLEAPMTARSVTVSRDGASTVGGGNFLAIGEFQLQLVTDLTLPLGTNLTRSGIVGMAVAQSSSHAAGPVGNGVDGNFGNFTHTLSSDTMPWWRVDLGEVMSLEQVFMFNRTSCCGERLRDITVRVLDENGSPVFTSDTLNPNNVEGFAGTGGGQLSVDLAALNGGAPVAGQMVEISRTIDPTGGTSLDDARVLALGEVQVFGGTLIPEPSATVLLGLAGLSCLLRRRR